MHDRFKPTVIAGLLAAVAGPVAAMGFETDVPDLKVRWDTTVGYSLGIRLDKPSAALTQGAPAVSFNDGDLNFAKRRRPMANRFDLFTEADVVYGNLGARASAAAWYDFAYQSGTANTSGLATPGPFNQARTLNNGSPGEFPDATRKLHGNKAEMLDAFVFGKAQLGAVPVSVRLGRHALVWGESLFFGGNGIAAGMAPTDLVKLQSAPNATVKETTRPTNQISAQAVLGRGVSVSAYYQFKFEKSRSAGVGSYFSTIDTIDVGGERSFIVTPFGLAQYNRTPNQEPPNSGQGGISANFSLPDSGVDVGLYAIQYHSKSPYSYAYFGGGPAAQTYELVYPQKIRAYGASFSTTAADNITVGGEASVRTNMPLTRGLIILPNVLKGRADGNDNAFYPVGETLHANLSTTIGMPPNFLSKEAVFSAELAWNRVMTCTRNCVNLPAGTFGPGTTGVTFRDGNAERDAYGMRMIYVPTYRQVFSGVDVSVPFGFSRSPEGRSGAVGPLFVHKGGDLNLGVTTTVNAEYSVSLRYTHYYGKEALPLNTQGFFNFGTTLKDRDHVMLSGRFSF